MANELPDGFIESTMQEGQETAVDGLRSKNYDLDALRRAQAACDQAAAAAAGTSPFRIQRLTPPSALNE